MHQMTWDEFQKTRQYVEKKALELMSHENKGHIVSGVPLECYRQFDFNGRVFYSVQVNTFKVIVDEHLMQAQERNPEKFGTGDAHDVIEALRLQHPFIDHDEFVNFLKHEKFAYVFEAEGGNVVDRMLRIDLFRLLKVDENGKVEFTGGLLHALKHFSRSGINYSTGKSNHELPHPQVLIGEIINAFFSLDGTFKSENEYLVLKQYDDFSNLKFVFYREEITGVFFLKTVYKETQ